MRLWDHRTPIRWHYKDMPSKPEEMDNPRYRFMLDEEIVLFDDGQGEVFSYATLPELGKRYGVDVSADPKGAQNRIRRLMSRHVPSKSEMSTRLASDERELSSHAKEIGTLGRRVTEGATETGRVSLSVARMGSEVKAHGEHLDVDDMALEELALMESENSDAVEAESEAIEELAPMLLDVADEGETMAVALEDVMLMLSDLTDRVNELSEILAEG